MDQRRPNHSLQGPSIMAPPTAPKGIPAFTRLFWRSLSPRSSGRYKLAPEMRDWSRPDSRPPMEAKATMTQVKWRGSLKDRSKKPVLRPPAAASSCSISLIRESTTWPPAWATATASFSARGGRPEDGYSTWSAAALLPLRSVGARVTDSSPMVEGVLPTGKATRGWA